MKERNEELKEAIEEFSGNPASMAKEIVCLRKRLIECGQAITNTYGQFQLKPKK